MSRFISSIERKKKVVQSRPAPGAPAQPGNGRYLMRVFYGDDLSSGLAWTKRGTFDGFISHLQYDQAQDAAAVLALVNDGKLFWRYEITQTYPYSRTDFGADKWADYLRSNWQFNGSSSGSTTKRRMLLTARNPDIVACFFGYLSHGSYGERYEMVPLQQFSLAELDSLASQQVSFARDLHQNGVYTIPNAGVFCDNAYHDMRAWMIPNDDTYGSGHGDKSETAPFLKTAYETTPYQTDWNDLCSVHGTPSSTWQDYGNRYTYLTAKVAALTASGSMFGQPAWRIANVPESGPNGTAQHAMPWFFENIWSTAAQNMRLAETSITEWKRDPRNVLHHVCDGTPTSWTRVMRHINEWLANGGWIEFTSDDTTSGDAQTETAYETAATARGQL